MKEENQVEPEEGDDDYDAEDYYDEEENEDEYDEEYDGEDEADDTESSSSSSSLDDDPDWLKEDLLASKTRARWGQGAAAIV